MIGGKRSVGMNKIFRSVWNASTGTWTAAHENAKSKGRGSSAKQGNPVACTGSAWRSLTRMFVLVTGCVGLTVPMIASASDICVTDANGAYDYSSQGQSQSGNCPWSTSTFAGIDTRSYVTMGDSGTAAMSISNYSVQFYLKNRATGTASYLTFQDLGAGGVTIDGLAPGVLSASSQQAVNGAQLYATNQNVTSVTNTVNAINNGGGIKYFHVNSTVADSAATATNAMAVGPAAKASGANASALGSAANAGGAGTTAIGASSQAVSAYTVAIGNSAYANSAGGVASGSSVAVGSSASASGSWSTALGTFALSSADASTAIGVNATASGDRSIAIGASAMSGGSYAFAVGTLALASGAQSSAVGVQANATANNAVALGYRSVGDRANAVSVGSATNLRQVIYVAAGDVSASSTDAVNGSQLYATNAKVGSNTTAIAALGDQVTQNATDISTLNNSITNISGTMADAVAYDSSAHDSVTLGGAGSTTPVALHNVAAGTLAATSTDAVNGAQLYATNAQVSSNTTSIAGLDARVAQNASDITNLASVINNGSMGMVQQDLTTRTITVAKNLDGAVVDFTGTSGARQLTGVSAGAVSAASVDAVNGAQLYAMAKSTASALGGTSTVNADGTISAPSYSIGGNTFTNVAGALTNIDSRVSNIEAQVSHAAGNAANAIQYDSPARDKATLGGAGATSTVQLSNLTNAVLSETSTDAVTGAQLYKTNQDVANLNQAIENIGTTKSEYVSINTSGGAATATGENALAQGGGAKATGSNATAMGNNAAATADNSVAIGADSVADQANTVSMGSQGNERRITNVADGKAPTDAVNMRQFQSGMSDVQRGAYSGVAAATALGMIPDVDPGKRVAVGVGSANYKGYQATALGASARINANIKVKAGAGFSAGGGTTVGGGMSYQW
jgi:autotransporter adhesin